MNATEKSRGKSPIFLSDDAHGHLRLLARAWELTEEQVILRLIAKFGEPVDSEKTVR